MQDYRPYGFLFVVELLKLVIWGTNRRNNGKLSILYSTKIDNSDFILLIINLLNCCKKVAIGCRLTPKSRPHLRNVTLPNYTASLSILVCSCRRRQSPLGTINIDVDAAARPAQTDGR